MISRTLKEKCCHSHDISNVDHTYGRAEKLRHKKANFFNTSMPAAREILNQLLDEYADYGIGKLDQLPRVFQFSPFDQYDSTTIFINVRRRGEVVAGSR